MSLKPIISLSAPIFALILAGCAVSTASQNGEENVTPFKDIKKVTMTREEFTAKIGELDAECAKKDPEKCHELGDLLAGAGDANTAVRAWDFTCANFWYMPSCMRLAGAFEAGYGIEQSSEKSQEIYRRACYAGYNKACKELKKEETDEKK